jgi:hypothetical protein
MAGIFLRNEPGMSQDIPEILHDPELSHVVVPRILYLVQSVG